MPVNVMEDPGVPEFALTLAMWGKFTVNGTALLMTPFCSGSTWALPVVDAVPTVAWIWVSLQLCTTPGAAPSQTWPGFTPKPEPAIVTAVTPGTPLVGVTFEIVAVLTVKGTLLDQAPPCCTWAVPDVVAQEERFSRAACEVSRLTVCKRPGVYRFPESRC